MVKRLLSPSLELAALRSITGDNERLAGFLLHKLGEDYFAGTHTREAYLRVRAVMERHGEIPRWSALLADPVLSEDVREELAHRPVDPIRTRREADGVVEQLDVYRRIRILFLAGRHIQQAVEGDSIDLDELTDYLAEALNGARTTTDVADHTTLIGGAQPDVEILREALTETEAEFIPTGIRVFDEGNQGVPRGSTHVIAGTTGGGKSALAVQVGLHQARIGARVGLVSLEMNRKIIVRRILSNLSGVPLSRINQAHRLDPETRRLLIRTWHDYHARVHQNGGRFRIVAPPNDMSLDEIVAMMRPYRYDNNILDYLGLTRGMDAEDQWRKMGAGVRMCTRVASADNSIWTILCQLSAEGMIRYSKTIMEHAHLAWTWTYVDEAVRQARIITIRQPKSRNLRNFDFHLRENFALMRFEDLDANALEEHRASRGKSRGRGRMGHNGGPPLDDRAPASIDDDRGRRPSFTQPDFRL